MAAAALLTVADIELIVDNNADDVDDTSPLAHTMFLRPVLRAAPLARVNAARALSSSAPRRGDHHDSHSSSSEADTTECA